MSDVADVAIYVVRGFMAAVVAAVACGLVLLVLDVLTDGGRDKLKPIKLAAFVGGLYLIGRFLP